MLPNSVLDLQTFWGNVLVVLTEGESCDTPWFFLHPHSPHSRCVDEQPTDDGIQWGVNIEELKSAQNFTAPWGPEYIIQ